MPGCRREPGPTVSTSSVRRRCSHDSKPGSGGAGWPKHRPGGLSWPYFGGSRTKATFQDNICHELVEPQSVTNIILKNGYRPRRDFRAPPAVGRAHGPGGCAERAGERVARRAVGRAQCAGGLVDWAGHRPIGTTTRRSIGPSTGRYIGGWGHWLIASSRHRPRSHGRADPSQAAEASGWPGRRLGAELGRPSVPVD